MDEGGMNYTDVGLLKSWLEITKVWKIKIGFRVRNPLCATRCNFLLHSLQGSGGGSGYLLSI
jgi:hypothetical protein